MSIPIKLLRIAAVGNDRRGGMSRTMYATGDHLADMGFEVDYLFADSFGARCAGRWRRFTGPWEVAGLIRNQIAKGKTYDLIEVHEPLCLGPGLLRYLRMENFRLVAFSYGLEDRCRPLMMDYNQRHGIPFRLKSRFTSWLQAHQSAYGLRFCDHVVCSNQEDVDYLKDRGFSPDHLTLHHSGMDDSMLHAGTNSVDQSRRDLLFLGSWLERKGVLDMVPAIAPILRNNPDLKFTIAGCQFEAETILASFPEDVRGQLQIIPKIHTDEELASIYYAHGIFVLPSYFEGQPLVMMEAAAFGMAIVTTPICGMLDFIRHGENGLLTPVGDPASLEACIQELVANPSKINRLGNAARMDARRHTWRASAENLATSYRNLTRQS